MYMVREEGLPNNWGEANAPSQLELLDMLRGGSDLTRLTSLQQCSYVALMSCFTHELFKQAQPRSISRS